MSNRGSQNHRGQKQGSNLARDYINAQKETRRALQSMVARGKPIPPRELVTIANRNAPVKPYQEIVADTILNIARINPRQFAEFLVQNGAEHVAFLAGVPTLCGVLEKPLCDYSLEYRDYRYAESEKTPGNATRARTSSPRGNARNPKGKGKIPLPLKELRAPEESPRPSSPYEISESELDAEPSAKPSAEPSAKPAPSKTPSLSESPRSWVDVVEGGEEVDYGEPINFGDSLDQEVENIIGGM